MSKETENEKIARERDDLQWVMGTEQGRRFMWRLLGECRVFHDFEGDTNQILKSVGRRQVGLFLQGVIIDADEMAYMQMQLESRNTAIEEIAHERSNNTSNTSDSDEYGSEFATYDSGSSLDSFL